ncbi:MAG TPA: nuclear transport factor 2 family protein [Hyphomicrobiaceae bacterium]|nr:nuclear transport factor 2 family protein [Hyphomicrobiaceae bacterium]
MRASDRMVLEATYAAWASRDLEATLACFDPEVVFIIHLPPDVMPYVGEVHGRAQLARTLQMILDDFDFLEYRPLQISAEGEMFHSRVRLHYRHKATGLDYEGTMRHVWQVAGDLIVRFEEFHDAERLRTFFALVKQALAHEK